MQKIFTKINKRRKMLPAFFVALLFIFVSIFSSFSFSGNAEAAINKQINYQGKLTTSAGIAVPNSSISIVFSLYTASSGGTAIWTETQSVTPSDGLFSVMLGENTALTSVNFNQTLYLGVKVGTDSEMTPRKKLGAVPAAIEAENAQTAQSATKATNLAGGNSSSLLGSIPYQSDTDTTSFVNPNVTLTKKFFTMTGTGTNGAVPLWEVLVAGDVGLGNVTNESKTTMFTSPTFTGTVAGFTMGGTLALGAYTFTTSNTGLVLNLNADLLDGQHGSYYQPLLTNPVTGTGTTNYLPKFTGTSALGNSLVYDNGTNVGIGTTVPNFSLHVKNASTSSYLAVERGGTSPSQLIFGAVTGATRIYSRDGATGDVPLYFQTGITDRMTIDATGNVGIGTTAPKFGLDVTQTIASRKAIVMPGVSMVGNYLYGPDLPTWSKQNGNYVNNSATSPDGTLSAATLTLTVTSWDLYLPTSVTAGVSYKIGVWVKLGTATNFCLAPNNSISFNTIPGKCFTSADGLNSSTWTHISWPFVGPASEFVNMHIGANGNSGAQQTAGTIYIWNFDITSGTSAAISSITDTVQLPGSSIWTSTGNVGIGTTSPGAKLHVSGGKMGIVSTSNVNGQFRVANTSDAEASMGFFTGLTESTFGNGIPNYLHAWMMGPSVWGIGTNKFGIGNTTDGAPNLVIQEGGNVGIGTTSPIAKLIVSGVAGSGGGSSVQTMIIDGAGGQGALTINSANTSTHAYQNFAQGGVSKFEFGIVPTTSDFYINSNIQSGSSGSSIYIKKADGNVGIGTTTPNAKLDVAGNTYLHGGSLYLDYVNGYSGGNITFNNTGNTTFSGNVGIGTTSPVTNGGSTTAMIHLNSATTSWSVLHTTNVDTGSAAGDGTVFGVIGLDTIISNYESGSLVFATNGGAEKMRILPTGNVGIGTTDPKGRLNTRALLPIDKMTLGSATEPGLSVTSYDGNPYGMYFGVNINGNSWIQAGRTDSATVYDLSLQASGGNVGIGTTSPITKAHIYMAL